MQYVIKKTKATKLSWKDSHLGNNKKQFLIFDLSGPFWCVESHNVFLGKTIIYNVSSIPCHIISIYQFMSFIKLLPLFNLHFHVMFRTMTFAQTTSWLGINICQGIFDLQSRLCLILTGITLDLFVLFLLCLSSCESLLPIDIKILVIANKALKTFEIYFYIFYL